MRRTAILLLLAVGACGGENETPAPLTASEPTALSGEQLFLACAACHSLHPAAGHSLGPNLHALNGRKAASYDDYAYSPALAAEDFDWNTATLTGWISGAERMVPGTWMLYHNHLSADETRRLVAYILDR